MNNKTIILSILSLLVSALAEQCAAPMKGGRAYDITDRVFDIVAPVEITSDGLFSPVSGGGNPIGSATLEFEEAGLLHLYVLCQGTGSNSWFINGDAYHFEPMLEWQWVSVGNVDTIVTFEVREKFCHIKGAYLGDAEDDYPVYEPEVFDCNECRVMEVDTSYLVAEGRAFDITGDLATEDAEEGKVLFNTVGAITADSGSSATLQFASGGYLYFFLKCEGGGSNSWFVNGDYWNISPVTTGYEWVEYGFVDAGEVTLSGREAYCFIKGTFMASESDIIPTEEPQPESAICEEQGSTNEMHVEFYRKAPKFKVFACKNPYDEEEGCADEYAKVKFGSIVERNAYGKKVRAIGSLASIKLADWDYDAEEKVITMVAPLPYKFQRKCKRSHKNDDDDDDDDDRRRSLHQGKRWGWWVWHKGKYSEDATMTIVVQMFPEEKEITYGDETIVVPANSMKFSIEAEGWGLCDEDNTLEFVMDIKTKGVEKEGPNTKKFTAIDGDNVTVRDDFVVTALSTPTFAFADDNERRDVAVLYKKRGIKTTVKYVLPYFEEALVYDPTVTLKSTVNSNDLHDAGVRVSSISSVFVVSIMLVALFM